MPRKWQQHKYTGKQREGGRDVVEHCGKEGGLGSVATTASDGEETVVGCGIFPRSSDIKEYIRPEWVYTLSLKVANGRNLHCVSVGGTGL